MSVTKRSLLGVGLLLAAVAVAPAAWAAKMTFSVPMNAQSESVPARSDAKGTAKLTYDPASKVLSWNIAFSGLTSPGTAAHFHGPGSPHQNAPIVIMIGGKGLKSPLVGHATLTTEQAADFMAGKWYVNIHTQDNPAGEIRGDITPPK